jgi:iron complex transport system permease protein
VALIKGITYVDMGTIAVERPASKVTTQARRRRVVGLGALVLILVAAGAVSLAVGARALSPGEVWHGLFAAPESDQRLTEIRLIVETVRVPRTASPSGSAGR